MSNTLEKSGLGTYIHTGASVVMQDPLQPDPCQRRTPQHMGTLMARIKAIMTSSHAILRQFLAILFCLGLLLAVPALANERPAIMVFGDSLVAGHGLPQGEAFPDILGHKLAKAGVDVRMINAGVSGDTTAGGLARLDWSLAENPQAAIIVLGGNDLLRGLPPEASFVNLDAIIASLRERNIPVLLAGMQAPRNFGADYAREFDAIYRRLVAKYDILFYPFFLDGVALQPDMNLSDGIHPNAAGIDHIATRMLPLAQKLVGAIQMR
ncbi:MAG: arylesterase [Candidatus Puniceispirillum sp.]